MARRAEMPGMWRGLLRSLRLGYQAEPRLLAVSFALVIGSYVPGALSAYWLKLLVDGAVAGQPGVVAWAAAALAASVTVGWLFATAGQRIQMTFSQRAAVALEAHVARLQAGIVGLEHHERPEYLDRLQVLKDQAFLLDHMYGALTEVCGLIVQLAISVGLLAAVSPALIALTLFAVPTAAVSSWRAGAERRAQEAAAPNVRLARHLFDLGTAAGPGKEVRASRTEADLLDRRRRAWTASLAPVRAARWTSATWHLAAWALFGVAYVAAVAFVALVLRSPAGSVLLVLAAGGGLSRYLATAIGSATFLRWTLDASSRLAWLEDYAATHRELADAPVPERIAGAIRLEGVSFRYPGTDRDILRDVTLELPAGSVVALVGDNGAGKTTLVKLLCRMYEPSAGRITLDGADLGRIPAEAWRARIAAVFQDSVRFELVASLAVGLGDLPRAADEDALATAVARGGAADVVARLPQGLATQLGPAWEGGVDLSGGQWQKLAVARGVMREQPLLLVLDEPTAALDAETEHALFERFAQAARGAQTAGRVTVIVSHRFSTVRMADRIVVLDGGRVAEFGSHQQLMDRGGLYAELYTVQSRGYR